MRYPYAERTVQRQVEDTSVDGIYEKYIAFSFGNGYYGNYTFDNGSSFREAKGAIRTARLNSENLFVDGSVHTIPKNEYLTGGSLDRSTWPHPTSSSLWEAYPTYVLDDGTVRFIVFNRAGNVNLEFPGEAVLFTLSIDNGVLQRDMMRVFDTQDNPLNASSNPSSPGGTGLIPPYLQGFSRRGWTTPYNNGMVHWVTYRRSGYDLSGTTISHRYMLCMHEQNSVVGDPIFVREEVILGDIGTHPDNEYWLGWGVQLGDKLVQSWSRGYSEIYLDVVDETGLVSTLDISSVTSNVLASGWLLDEVHLRKVNNNKALLFVRQGLGVQVVEVFFDGQDLTLGQKVLISSVLNSNHPVCSTREYSSEFVVLSSLAGSNLEIDDHVEYLQQFPDLGDIDSGGDISPHDEFDVFIIRQWFIDGNEDGNIKVVRDYWKEGQVWNIPFSWWSPDNGTYVNFQDVSFNHVLYDNGKLICFASWQANPTSVTSFVVPLHKIIPPLRLKKRDDHNKYGSPRLRTPLVIQGSSKQSRQRIATPNTYW